MALNPYIQHYGSQDKVQKGEGIPGYRGQQFPQGGQGFPSFLKGAFLPLLKYFGKKALSTGIAVAKDTLGGENFIDSFKTQAKSTVRNIASDAGERAMKFAQTGKGRKRKRRAQFGKGKKRKHFVQLGNGKKRKRNSQLGKGKKKRKTKAKKRKSVQLGRGKKRNILKTNPKLISSIFN